MDHHSWLIRPGRIAPTINGKQRSSCRHLSPDPPIHAERGSVDSGLDQRPYTSGRLRTGRVGRTPAATAATLAVRPGPTFCHVQGGRGSARRGRGPRSTDGRWLALGLDRLGLSPPLASCSSRTKPARAKLRKRSAGGTAVVAAPWPRFQSCPAGLPGTVRY